jgi:hypothetical protein
LGMLLLYALLLLLLHHLLHLVIPLQLRLSGLGWWWSVGRGDAR